MNYREALLKHMSLEELEKAINSIKTELKGLVSTEGCEYLLANDLGIQKKEPKQNVEENQEKVVSQERLFQRFTDFINLLDGKETFLDELSNILGEIFAHNKCCHQAYVIPNIEDINFNEFIKRIKEKYYLERIEMNDGWFHQEDNPSPEDTEAYKGNDTYYRHMLEHLNTSFEKEFTEFCGNENREKEN